MIQLPDGSTKVQVTLVDNVPGRKPLFNVRVYSAKRQGIVGAALSSQLPVDPADGDTHVKVMLVAGGLAEYQNRQYRDRHDPDEVAKAAGEAFRMLMDQLKRKVPAEQRDATVVMKMGEARPKNVVPINFESVRNQRR